MMLTTAAPVEGTALQDRVPDVAETAETSRVESLVEDFRMSSSRSESVAQRSGRSLPDR